MRLSASALIFAMALFFTLSAMMKAYDFYITRTDKKKKCVREGGGDDEEIKNAFRTVTIVNALLFYNYAIMVFFAL